MIPMVDTMKGTWPHRNFAPVRHRLWMAVWLLGCGLVSTNKVTLCL